MKVIYNFTYVVLYTGFECLSQLTAFTFTAQNTNRSPFFPLSQCCDLGYHASLNRALRTYLSAEYNVETSKHGGLETLRTLRRTWRPTQTSKGSWRPTTTSSALRYASTSSLTWAIWSVGVIIIAYDMTLVKLSNEICSDGNYFHAPSNIPTADSQCG